MKTKKIIISAVIIIGLVALFGYFYKTDKKVEAGNATASAKDVLGTRTGTSTPVGQGFYGAPAANATTSKAINIGNDTDSVSFTVRIMIASSTPSGRFTWSILGSNDMGCETASTSAPTLNSILVKDILWNIADPTASEVQGQITTGTSNATGTVITLTDINWNCLRFEGNGSSTSAWVQAVWKTN